MSKSKTIFICSKCDSQFPKWFGQCPECGEWGVLEERAIKNQKSKGKNFGEVGEVIEFEKIKTEDWPRIKTEIEELDRVLGGGFVPGSVILLGGEPGIGKSTLVLQIAEQIQPRTTLDSGLSGTLRGASQNSVLYISGEESAEQVKMRIDRLGLKTKNLKFLGETNIETICATIEKEKPVLAIIDSIQTMFSPLINSEAGSISQVRTSTAKLLEVAKKNKISILITAHVTKEGIIAGPKTLEHLVDTVCYLEGDPYHQFRLLRAAKNRFGSTNEVGVFEMREEGLVEVKNPSVAFLSQREEKNPGSVIAAILAGGRSFLVEVQALVAKTSFGYPQRRTIGLDFNRTQLLIAVLSRRLGLPLGNYDIHLNVVGGLKVEEPAVDLAVCLAIISAYKNKAIDSDLAVFGEVGLGGEIRQVFQEEKRIREAEKLEFKKIIKPVSKLKIKSQKLKIIEVRNLSEVLDLF
ncbi:MAG: DNA repair protein RadA [Patescibacteria group bacterium]|nr:DNA repair protein RadA [Patescibacteria group bacterium]